MTNNIISLKEVRVPKWWGKGLSGIRISHELALLVTVEGIGGDTS